MGAHSGTQVCSVLPVLQVACYGVRVNKNQQERKNVCLGGGCLQKMMRLCRVGATAAQSQISPSPALCHTSICSSLSLSLPGSVLHSAQIKIVSSICHIPGSAPAVSNDPVSPDPVTLQQYSVHPEESAVSISPSAFLIFCLPILMLSPLLLLLPTHSFSIHILEDIYEHQTEHVHLHHFRCRGNLHFLLEPSPVPLLFLI